MVSSGHDDNIIAPKSLLIPIEEPIQTIANPAKGQMVMSGGHLFVSDGATWFSISGASIT